MKQLSTSKGFTTFGLHERGFTILELIVVFSILAIISTIGIASFQKYGDSQKFRKTVLDIKTLLQKARSQSLSQINICAAGTTFQGYAVELCCQSGGLGCPPNCTTGNDYELDSVCSAAYTTVPGTGKKLPNGVAIDSSTSPRSFKFIPITGGVVQGGSIVLNGANSTKQTITVTNSGIIQ